MAKRKALPKKRTTAKKHISSTAPKSDMMSFGSMPIPLVTRDDRLKNMRASERRRIKNQRKSYIDQWSEKDRKAGKQSLAEKSADFMVNKYYVDNETAKRNQFFELMNIVSVAEIEDVKSAFKQNKQYKIVTITPDISAIYEETWYDKDAGKWI